MLLQKAASAVQNETIASSTDAEVDDGSDGIIHVVELHIVLGDLEEAGTTNELGMVSLRLDDELLGMDTELAWTMDELLGDSVDVVHDSIVHPEFGNADHDFNSPFVDIGFRASLPPPPPSVLMPMCNTLPCLWLVLVGHKSAKLSYMVDMLAGEMS